jgi:hypothetical protein
MDVVENGIGEWGGHHELKKCGGLETRLRLSCPLHHSSTVFFASCVEQALDWHVEDDSLSGNILWYAYDSKAHLSY